MPLGGRDLFKRCMGEISYNIKPQHAVGEAVFTSYDGLRVEGNGELKFLTFAHELLEMRSDSILDALSPATSRRNALFLQVIDAHNTTLWIVGLVRKISDLHNRPGIIGACICVSKVDRKFALQDCNYIDKVLLPKIESTMSCHSTGSPPSERLNLLTGVPQHEFLIDYKFKPRTELLHRVLDDQVSGSDVINAGFDLIEVSESIGRVLVLPDANRGTRPADQNFIDMVRNEKAKLECITAAKQTWQPNHRTDLQIEQLRDLRTELSDQSNITDDIFKRLDDFERRLSVLEEPVITSEDSTFTGKGNKAKTWNVVEIGICAVLAITVIILMSMAYHLATTGKETNRKNLQSDIETPIESDLSQPQVAPSHSPPEQPESAIDCGNPRNVPEEAFCNELEK